jgi:hypothetical protein
MSVERIGGEPVERVRRWGDLRNGALVWYVDCTHCGGRHRGLLLKKGPFWGVLADGTRDDSPAWLMAPKARCGVELLNMCAVRRGAVWLVTNPPREEPTDTEAAKPRKAVRA